MDVIETSKLVTDSQVTFVIEFCLSKNVHLSYNTSTIGSVYLIQNENFENGEWRFLYLGSLKSQMNW